MSTPEWNSPTSFVNEDHHAQHAQFTRWEQAPALTTSTSQLNTPPTLPGLVLAAPPFSANAHFYNSFTGLPAPISVQKPSPAPSTTTEPESQSERQGAKLDEHQRLILLSICVSYQRIYLDDKPMKAFWTAVTRQFQEKTGNKHVTLNDVVRRMVAQRQKHLARCGTGTEPDGGELNQRLDKWIEILAQKDVMRGNKKKSTDEVLREANASKIDRQNMKLSLSQKRDREEAFATGSQTGSDTDENDESDAPGFSENALGSSSPQALGSSPTLQRKTASRPPYKLQKQSPRKSSLSNEVRWMDMFKESASILAQPANAETTTRLAALEKSQEQLTQGHTELKTQNGQMLTLLQVIYDKLQQP